MFLPHGLLDVPVSYVRGLSPEIATWTAVSPHSNIVPSERAFLNTLEGIVSFLSHDLVTCCGCQVTGNGYGHPCSGQLNSGVGRGLGCHVFQ